MAPKDLSRRWRGRSIRNALLPLHPPRRRSRCGGNVTPAPWDSLGRSFVARDLCPLCEVLLLLAALSRSCCGWRAPGTTFTGHAHTTGSGPISARLTARVLQPIRLVLYDERRVLPQMLVLWEIVYFVSTLFFCFYLFNAVEGRVLIVGRREEILTRSPASEFWQRGSSDGRRPTNGRRR